MTTDSAALRLDKSTNVRARKEPALPPLLRALQAGFPHLSRLAPRVAGAAADWLFFTPTNKVRGTSWPDGGRAFAVDVDGVLVRGRAFGEGPVVFLVHGWAGDGAQMSAFVEPLVARGYSVVGWDAPGHGASGGWRSSFVTLARAVHAVAGIFGAPHAVVAHSLGGSAAVLAARQGLPVSRLCLVGTPARPIDWIESFVGLLGLGPEAVAHLRHRSETRLGVSWDALDVPPMAAEVHVPTLLVQDANDKEVAPMNVDKLAAAMPHAEVLHTTGLGHRRVLRDASVLAAVVDHIGPAPSPQAELEQWLFDRDDRSRAGSRW
jgi:pimeloyl-ACP methyl ester carboxylesterase